MASNKLTITDLEFDDIKSNLKSYLSAQSQFADYDFAGSGMDVLLDVLAYNTHYMGYYANMAVNEMFIDSASLRESVVSHAKHLNVIPASVTASTAYLDMTFTPSGSPLSLSIAKNTKFTTSISGRSYTFTTTANKTIYPIAGTYSVTNLPIREGTIVNKKYTVNLADTTQRFVVPNRNVDISTITVQVQNSSSDTAVTTWTNANALDVTTIASTQKVFWIQEVEEQKYEILFGDGAVGAQLADANIIFIEYLVTSGLASNKASSFTAVGTVAGLSSANYTLTVASAASGGAEIESVASLKTNAPKLYQAQKRATTKEDYKAILLGERSDIESITVYGGEDASPAVYGKVYIAVKPNGNTAFSAATKDAIKTSILKKTNVVTVTPEIVDPIFYYLLIDTTINYDPVTLLTNEDTLKSLISSTITNYFSTSLQKFDNKFRYSKLAGVIDDTNSSIRNSKTSIRYQMQIAPMTLAVAATYTVEFNTTLAEGTLTSTAFTASDGYTYTLFDDSLGVVKLIRSTYTSATDSIAVDSPVAYMTLADGSQNLGTIDYTTGKVVLNNFTPYTISDGKTYIKMIVTPGINNQDITPLREQIITTDSTDTAAINITMVAETIV
jgi:hypothetical protein|tara:strand:- start:2098 stop:3939 length:1842 start_codon:yes stop_codon:yes gene_type:complete